MITLAEIQTEVELLARIIGAPYDILPTYGYSIDFAHPYIEVRNNIDLRYMAQERGKEVFNNATFDLDELLYWVFKDVTRDMATHYELEHRQSGVDTRRMCFAKNVELLNEINMEWGKRRQEEFNEILIRNPFVDKSF